MPLRRTIGISLALIMVSAGANAKATAASGRHQVESAKRVAEHSRAARILRRIRVRRRLTVRLVRQKFQHPIRSVRYRITADPRTPDRFVAPANANRPEIGRAAWYDLVGHDTSSGEPFRANTPTAAHRTLPLLSYARVTDLDNGRSVVVKVNDRGPWTPGLLIDLSKGAAKTLHMIRAGVVRVAVQPLGFSAPEPAPGVQLAAQEPAATPLQVAQQSISQSPKAAPAATPRLAAYRPAASPAVAQLAQDNWPMQMSHGYQ